MSDESLPKVMVIIAGGTETLSEDQRAILLNQIRDQQLNPDLEWEDITVLSDPELIAAALRTEEDQDPYQKYWDKILVEESLGKPRVYH